MKVIVVLSLLLLPLAARPISIGESELRRDSLMAKVESLGYVIESAGKIVQREDRQACGLIRLNFDAWLDDEEFKIMVDEVLSAVEILAEDLKPSIARLACEFNRDAKEIFDFMTARFERYCDTENAVLYNVRIPWIDRMQSFVPFVELPSWHRDSSLNMTKKEKTAKIADFARDDIREKSNILLSDLKKAISDPGSLFEQIPTDFYKNIASIILDANNIEKHGILNDKTARITTKGRDGDDSIVVEACVSFTRGDMGVEGFHIRPYGYVKENIYTYPMLPTLYAMPEGKSGVDGLLVAGGIEYKKDGILIVDKIDAQDPDCSFASRSHCPLLRINMSDYGGTLAFPLEKNALVVTNEEYAECIQSSRSPVFTNKTEALESGHTTEIFPLESPIMIHNTLSPCTLYLGDQVVADPAVYHYPKYEGIISEPDSDQLASEKRWKFVHEIGYPIAFVVLLIIILVLIFVLIFVLCKLKRDSAETDYQLFD